MIVTGVAFLVFWVLQFLFGVEALTAALATGVGFIVVGLLFGERFSAFRR